MSDTVEACPECDSVNLRNTVGHYLGDDAGHDGNACNDCGATFSEPKEREQKNSGDPRSGIAGKLSDPDVRDASDLVTDGGRNYSETQFMTTESDWYDCESCGAEYRDETAASGCCTGCSE